MGAAGEQGLKAILLTALSLFPHSYIERQVRQASPYACGAPTAYLDILAMAMALHTGILQCTLFDAKADGTGNTMSIHGTPFLLGRFLVRTHL